MNGNKVLVTGGFGNLGIYIVKHLINLNYEVTILTRREKYKLENLKYKVVECDITNLEELNLKLNFEIDFCVHTASFNEFFLPNYPQKALEINTLGTRNLLEILCEKKIKNFIYVSTFHVYGIGSGIIEEDTMLQPKNDYASTHLFAEYYINQFSYTHHLPFVILRLTNSYGVPVFNDTNKWYLVLNDLVKMAFEKEEIVLLSNGEARRDFIYMGDVAIIIDNLLNITAPNDTYNLSSAKSYKIIDLANQVRSEYLIRYNKDINIIINEADNTLYQDIIVKNDKLKSIIEFTFRDMISSEINKIFNMLEKNI